MSSLVFLVCVNYEPLQGHNFKVVVFVLAIGNVVVVGCGFFQLFTKKRVPEPMHTLNKILITLNSSTRCLLPHLLARIFATFVAAVGDASYTSFCLLPSLTL